LGTYRNSPEEYRILGRLAEFFAILMEDVVMNGG